MWCDPGLTSGAARGAAGAPGAQGYPRDPTRGQMYVDGSGICKEKKAQNLSRSNMMMICRSKCIAVSREGRERKREREAFPDDLSTRYLSTPYTRAV